MLPGRTEDKVNPHSIFSKLCFLKAPVPVTVGTAIANRPRADPCKRNYRTRLLPWMGWRRNARQGKDAGREDEGPPFEGWAKTLPARTAALAATPEHGAPQVAERWRKRPNVTVFPGYSMIAVVAFHNTFQPLPDDVDRSCIRSRSTA